MGCGLLPWIFDLLRSRKTYYVRFCLISHAIIYSSLPLFNGAPLEFDLNMSTLMRLDITFFVWNTTTNKIYLRTVDSELMLNWVHLQLPFVCFLLEDLGATEPTLPELLKAWHLPKKIRHNKYYINLQRRIACIEKYLQGMDLFDLFY